jgi:hypothetical protein
MDAASITAHIVETLGGVDVVVANGDSFFYYDPGHDVPADYRLPFATLVTSDAYDQASNLNRPGVFRLNVGVGRETYRALFGQPPAMSRDGGVANTGHDFTALDVVMPHPVYAALSWVCILSPSDDAFQTMKPLLVEAYAEAVSRYARTHPSNDAPSR